MTNTHTCWYSISRLYLLILNLIVSVWVS